MDNIFESQNDNDNEATLSLETGGVANDAEIMEGNNYLAGLIPSSSPTILSPSSMTQLSTGDVNATQGVDNIKNVTDGPGISKRPPWLNPQPAEDYILRREATLGIAPQVSGSLSMIGSLLVAYKIINHMRQGKGKSYNYIILTMCFVDFIASLAYSFGPRLSPPGPAPKLGQPYRFGAFGNEGTCTAQGFLIQFGISIIFLNFCLSLHYISVIRWRFGEDRLRRYVGPCIAFVFLIGIGLSVPPLFLESYGYNPVWCWISPNIKRCAEEGLSKEECQSRSYWWRDLLYFIPLWIMVILTTFVQLGIVYTVWQTKQRSKKWRFEAQQANRRRRASTTSIASDGLSGAASILSRAKADGIDGGNRRRTSETSVESAAEGSSPMEMEPGKRRRRRRSSTASIKMKRRRARKAKRQLESTQRVALQSFLYLSSFYISWLPWVVAAHIIPKVPNIMTDSRGFWLVFLVTVFQPLQGFLNCMAYYHVTIFRWCEKAWTFCFGRCPSPTEYLCCFRHDENDEESFLESTQTHLRNNPVSQEDTIISQDTQSPIEIPLKGNEGEDADDADADDMNQIDVDEDGDGVDHKARNGKAQRRFSRDSHLSLESGQSDDTFDMSEFDTPSDMYGE